MSTGLLLVQALLSQGPYLLLCGAGALVACWYVRRTFLPAFLALLGFGGLTAVSVVNVVGIMSVTPEAQTQYFAGQLADWFVRYGNIVFLFFIVVAVVVGLRGSAAEGRAATSASTLGTGEARPEGGPYRHRGHAILAWACASLIVPVLPLGIVVWGVSRSHLMAMKLGVMDAAGRGETRVAHWLSGVSATLFVVIALYNMWITIQILAWASHPMPLPG